MEEAQSRIAEVKKTLLFISYFAGIKGNCPAEWADDKIFALRESGREVVVLTGISSHVKSSSGVKYVRVPSLSWNDCKCELNELKSAGESVPTAFFLFLPLAFLLGLPLDFLLRKMTKGVSSGRWSWVISALPVALWLRISHRIGEIFCTGGPPAAHVVGGCVAAVSKSKLYCEFQDPLMGAMMFRSGMARRIARALESWLIQRSRKVVYVTEEAARSAKERNPERKDQIVGIYPGSRKFVSNCSVSHRGEDDPIEFLHLGTLYGSRNLDTFFEVLDALKKEGFLPAMRVKVVNLGAVYCAFSEKYKARDDFDQLDALERKDALERAQKASCLLLVQHVDDRSRETIPYKAYDYLNLGLPVFGILNNDELANLIQEYGGVTGRAGNVESLKTALQYSLTALSSGEFSVQRRSFDIVEQLSRVFV